MRHRELVNFFVLRKVLDVGVRRVDEVAFEESGLVDTEEVKVSVDTGTGSGSDSDPVRTDPHGPIPDGTTFWTVSSCTGTDGPK